MFKELAQKRRPEGAPTTPRCARRMAVSTSSDRAFVP
jgi:hypothetical protein